VREVIDPLRSQGAIVLEHPHSEADDLAAGVARWARSNTTSRLVIVTGDSDFLQLVGGCVHVHSIYGDCALSRLSCGDPHTLLLRKVLMGDNASERMGQKLRPCLRVDVSCQDPAARGSTRTIDQCAPRTSWRVMDVEREMCVQRSFADNILSTSAQCHTKKHCDRSVYVSLRNMVCAHFRVDGVCGQPRDV
jgi:hypothetical protein